MVINMNQILQEIGFRLREYRKSLGITQAEAAAILEMSCNFYGDIERGKCRLSIEKIILVNPVDFIKNWNDKFGIDPTYLLTGKKAPKVSFYDLISDCPQDKIFDMEQIVRYASNLYRKGNI